MSTAQPALPRSERIALAIGFGIVLLFFTFSAHLMFYRGQGDYAINAQLVENIAHTGRPTSDLLFAVTKDASPLYSQPAAVIAKEALSSHDYRRLNYFHFHFYGITYLYAFFQRLIPTDVLLPLVYMTSYVGLLLLLYVFLRRKDVAATAALAFCGLITLHPAWGLTLFGQFYNDRLFVLLGFAFVFNLDRPRPRYPWLIGSGVLCLLIVEKCGFIAGAFALSYTVLYWSQIKPADRIKYLAIGLGLALFSWLIVKFYINAALSKQVYGTYLSDPLYFLSNPTALANLRVFLTVNLPLLVILGIFDWRALLIGLFVLLPNVCGNIGGAEKTGWVTHYHAMYFPIYVWAAASGYARLCARPRRLLLKLVGFSAVAALALFYVTVDPYQPQSWHSRPIRAADISWVGAYRLWVDSFDPQGYQRYVMARTRFLRAAVPEGSSVSCPEGLMPALYHDRKVDLYPAGVDRDDAVVMQVDASKKGLDRYAAMVGYISAAEDRRIDTVIIQRMAKHGFDVEHPQVFGDFAVFHRKRPS